MPKSNLHTQGTRAFAIPADALLEHRSKPRQRVLKTAMASYDEHFTSMACIVRNMSETGARLEFDDFGYVPTTFTLYVPVDAYKVECENIWQHGKICGVRFTSGKTHIKSSRSQTLKSSETALSGSVMREIERLDRDEQADRQNHAVSPARPVRRAPTGHVFGKRH